MRSDAHGARRANGRLERPRESNAGGTYTGIAPHNAAELTDAAIHRREPRHSSAAALALELDVVGSPLGRAEERHPRRGLACSGGGPPRALGHLPLVALRLGHHGRIGGATVRRC